MINKTVLIIDDDDILRDSLATGLRNTGMTVLTAPSAEAGKQIIKRVSVDAIVLDRMMDKMDGLTFLKKLREAKNETPVLMLTAMTGPENTVDGLTHGANDYLAKPFQFQELILRLNNIMRTNSTNNNNNALPVGLTLIEDEFFITTDNDNHKILGLSAEEKKLLTIMVSPIGNIGTASPMVAKRLRSKINSVLSNIDIITVRGQGYKIIELITKGD